MAYYDRIAKQWHQATGYEGGAFKKLVLNDRLLRKIPGIHGHSILELGAGNGYFLPLVFRRFSGQVPARVIITDISEHLLEIAERQFRIPTADYRRLDVGRPFPFETNGFDLILAQMIFNELPSRHFKNALAECHRILSADGFLLITVVHPKFVSSLQRRGQLVYGRESGLTMPGAGNLRLPVVIRSQETYRRCLTESGFDFEEEEVYPTPAVLNVKAGLRQAGKVSLALVFSCGKRMTVPDLSD